MNSMTLVSLAMLKVNADVRGSDYLEYVVPFVEHAISALEKTDFAADDVQAVIKNEFGLAIPKNAVELALRRMAGGHGKIERRHKQFRRKSDVELSSLGVDRIEALRREKVVINALVTDAASRGVIWTSDEATDAFLQYLTSFSIECLRTYAQGTALPALKESSKSTELYVVNAFVRKAHETSAELFDSIMVLVKGHMLANALICPDLSATKQKFSEVSFFLDTPLVLDALGLHGVDAAAAARELIELLLRLKGSIAVFEHTFLEVDGVIRSSESRYGDPDARTRVITEAKRAGRTPSDLALVRAQLEKKLAELRIARLARPQHEPAFQIDEVALEAELERALGYSHDGAARNDVESMRSIYALRRGKAPTRLENAIAVVVTTNPGFARVAYQFGQVHESSREVSTVITDFSLANIAWLKAPLGAPDLPRLEVLANCYAAMEPPPALWARYLAEIEKLRAQGTIGPEEHEILRFSLQARDELMDVVLRDGEHVSAQTVVEVIEQVKADLVRDRDQTIDEQQGLISRTAAERDDVSRRFEALRAERERRLKKAYWLSDTVSKWVSWGTSILVGGAVVCAALLWPAERWVLSMLSVPETVSIPVSIVGWLLVAMSAIANGLWGWSVRDISQRVRNRTRQTLYKMMLRAMFEDVATPMPQDVAT